MNFHQTDAHAHFLQSIGWKIETIGVGKGKVYIFIRTLPLLQISLMKIQRISLSQIDWEEVIRLEKRHHVYETVIELDLLTQTIPKLDPVLLSQGFKPAVDYMLTTKTRIIDLKKSDTDILQEMKPKARYNVHFAAKHGLQSHIWLANDVADDQILFGKYYDLLRQNAKRIGMLLLPKEWIKKQLTAFGKQGFVVGVAAKDSPSFLNAALFFTSQDTCSYSHNGSTDLGRKLMAPTLTIWEGIKEGKRRGLRFFDFDGVYDERYPKQKRFQGFGRFKAGFGGNEFYFPPMYRKYRFPF